MTTITMHEKGKSVDESGGMVVTMDSWLAPKIPALNEVAEFDRRYAEKLYGPVAIGASAEQMAAAMAMYPMLKEMLGRVQIEGEKLDGTPIQQTAKIDAVKSAEQAAQDKPRENDSSSKAPPTSVSGILGGLARRAAKPKAEGNDAQNAQPAQNRRATVMTMTTEVM